MIPVIDRLATRRTGPLSRPVRRAPGQWSPATTRHPGRVRLCIALRLCVSASGGPRFVSRELSAVTRTRSGAAYGRVLMIDPRACAGASCGPAAFPAGCQPVADATGRSWIGPSALGTRCGFAQGSASRDVRSASGGRAQRVRKPGAIGLASCGWRLRSGWRGGPRPGTLL